MFEYQKVRLIGITKGPELSEFDSGVQLCAEDIISYCARVSNPKNQENFDTASKLLKYLMDHSHWSPFEMASVTLEIETTRDIGRQILRHRSFSFQEFSQRYAEVNTDSFVLRETRLQDTKNRQNSFDTDDSRLKIEWEQRQRAIQELSERHYNWAIQNGIAKEQARVILPEGLTMSRMYMAGNLRSWITFVALREKNGTQKEHIDIALKCKRILLDEFVFLQNTFGNDINNPWNI